MKQEDLKFAFTNLCQSYLKAFCDKHAYDIEWDFEHDYVWVGGEPGTVANICDMFVGFDDIRYDIDNDVPPQVFEQWYWKSLDRAEKGIKFMKYPSFCKGCPDPITPEQEAKIDAARKRLIEAKKQFEEAIKDVKDPNFSTDIFV